MNTRLRTHLGSLFAYSVCLLAVACSSSGDAASDDEQTPEEAVGALAQGPSRGDPITYLGVNSTSREHEIAGLRSQADLTVVSGSKVNGTYVLEGVTFDVTTDAGVEGFLARLGIVGAAQSALTEAFKRSVENTVDEIAALIVLFHDLEGSGRPLRRLVLSGHSGGSGIGGELPTDAEVYFSNLAYIAQAFPKAAASVEHLGISACNTAFDTHKKDWLFAEHRAIFPRLRSIWAYKGPSPTIPGSTEHLKAWERGTRPGATAASLDAARRTAAGFGGANAGNVRVWTAERIVGE